ncbi:hypothetical protein SprV_0100392400 [Sparganum proliferum]
MPLAQGSIRRKERSHQQPDRQEEQAALSLARLSNRYKQGGFNQCRRPAQQQLREISGGSMLLTEKSQTLKRWAENLRSVLSRPFPISKVAIDRLPQVKIYVHLDLLPSLSENIRDL